MRKIIVFSLVSLVAYAVPVIPEPANNSSIFIPESGHIGRIKVTGNVSTDVQGTKYVIYASDTPEWNENKADTQLNLGTFYFAQTKAGANFEKTPPKVYVKKLSGMTATPLGVDEVAKFKMVFDSEYQGAYIYGNNVNTEIGAGEAVTFPTTYLIPPTVWQDIVNKAKSDPAKPFNDIQWQDSWKMIYINGRYYMTPTALQFHSPENGVVEFKLVDNPHWSDAATVTDANYIESRLGEVDISGLSIIVRIDGAK